VHTFRENSEHTGTGRPARLLWGYTVAFYTERSQDRSTHVLETFFKSQAHGYQAQRTRSTHMSTYMSTCSDMFIHIIHNFRVSRMMSRGSVRKMRQSCTGMRQSLSRLISSQSQGSKCYIALRSLRAPLISIQICRVAFDGIRKNSIEAFRPASTARLRFTVNYNTAWSLKIIKSSSIH